MSPVHRIQNRFNTPHVIADFTEPFLTPARVIPGSPRSQRLMTFIVNPSPRLSVVRQIAAVKIVFAIDYNTLNQRVRAQFLYGWTPNPGTAFYAGYNDDLNYGFNAISSSIIPGFRRNGRTFFVKMSYLFRKSF